MSKAWTKEREYRKLSSKDRTRIREQILLRDRWTCQKCGLTSMDGMEVDHIIPLSKGGSEEDLENLQVLCTECHGAKTIRESGGRPKAAFGVDGWPVGGGG